MTSYLNPLLAASSLLMLKAAQTISPRPASGRKIADATKPMACRFSGMGRSVIASHHTPEKSTAKNAQSPPAKKRSTSAHSFMGFKCTSSEALL
jgi:hypothetical protein